MKKIISFIAAMALVLCLLPATALAMEIVTGEVDGLTYSIENDQVTITGCTAVPETGIVTIPDTVGGYPVTAIGDEAFADWYSELLNVVIPATITSIGTDAFRNCRAFTGNQYDNGIYIGSEENPFHALVFSLDTGVTGYRIHPNTKLITDLAFSKPTVQDQEDWHDLCSVIQMIYFEGDAPIFCGDVFSVENQQPVYDDNYQLLYYETVTESLDTAVHYLADNATWTEDVCQNYGGTINWIAGTNAGTCGENASWSFEGDTLTISGTGAMEDYTTFGAPWFNYKEIIGSVIVEEGIQRIGNHALSCCYLVCEVTLSESLTEIGNFAFWQCGLERITIPKAVTTVGAIAFGDNIALTDITFQGSAPTIGNNAFKNITASVTYPADDSTWTSDVMLDYGGTLTWMPCVEIVASGICGDDLTWTLDTAGTLTISGTGDMYDFATHASPWNAYREQITAVSFSEEITAIGMNAFYGCTGITAVDIPNSVTQIGAYAFYGCEGIQQLTLPASDVECGSCIFAGCTSLTELTIPEGLPVVTECMFSGCYSLKTVTLPDTVGLIGVEAFTGCSALETVNLSQNLVTIENCSFSWCQSLKEITIPASVENIGNLVFYRCDSLGGIVVDKNNTAYCSDRLGALLSKDGTTLLRGPYNVSKYMVPEGVTLIKGDAFQDCIALQSVTLPKGLVTIEDFSFSGCTALTKITFEEGAQANIGCNAFQNVTASVHCAVDDALWMEVVSQDYGGSLVWMTYIPASTVPTLTLKYPTVAFEDEVILNVYFDAADLQDTVEMGLLTFTAQPDTVSADTAATVTPGYSFSETEQLYLVTSNGIAAKDLGDTIYLTVYAKLSDGSYVYTPVASYSPQTYAYNLLETGSEEMQSMVVSMLNYGAAAQSYFGSEEALVNGKLTETQLAMAESYRSDMMSPVVAVDEQKTEAFTKTGGFTTGYPTVSFEGAFSINYYFTPANTVASDVQLYYWTADDYSAAEALTAENASGILTMEAPIARTATGYQAAVENIAAKDLDDTVYVACVYSDGTAQYCSGVLAYSIGAYCSAQAAKTGTLADLAAATAVYGYYAKQLFS